MVPGPTPNILLNVLIYIYLLIITYRYTVKYTVITQIVNLKNIFSIHSWGGGCFKLINKRALDLSINSFDTCPTKNHTSGMY